MSETLSNPSNAPKRRMPLVDALHVLAEVRRDEIVVTTMGSLREWAKFPAHPLDLHYIPSAMGQSPILGLGLALARSDRHVIAFCGDGGLLMNLGCLVTIVAAGSMNVTLIVVQNGIYEVTGGQATVAAETSVDLAKIARDAGFATVAEFDDLADWRQRVSTTLKAPGPRCIVLHVEPVGVDYQLPTLEPIGQRLARFVESLQMGG